MGVVEVLDRMDDRGLDPLLESLLDAVVLSNRTTPSRWSDPEVELALLG